MKRKPIFNILNLDYVLLWRFMDTAVLNIKCSSSQFQPPFYGWNIVETASNTKQSINKSLINSHMSTRLWGCKVQGPFDIAFDAGSCRVNDIAFQIVGFLILN